MNLLKELLTPEMMGLAAVAVIGAAAVFVLAKIKAALDKTMLDDKAKMAINTAATQIFNGLKADVKAALADGKITPVERQMIINNVIAQASALARAQGIPLFMAVLRPVAESLAEKAIRRIAGETPRAAAPVVDLHAIERPRG